MTVEIIYGDAREVLAAMPEGSVHCAITSPPYWGLRDYGLEPVVWGGSPECEHEWGDDTIAPNKDSNRASMKWITGGNPGAKVRGERPSQGAFCRRCSAWRGSLGLEPTIDLYVEHIVQVMRQVRRVLRKDGTLWLNMGDSYAGSAKGIGADGIAYGGAKQRTNAGSIGLPVMKDIPGLKPKDLVGVPWRVAFALQADGWWLRSDIIWSKPNPMPESVTDRPTRSHEYVFLLAKSGRYFWDADAIRESSSPNSHGGGIPGEHRQMAQAGRNDGKSAMGILSSSRNKRSVWEIATQPFSARALGGGTSGTRSPDCPVHGESDLARQGRRQALGDELQGRQSSGTAGSDARHGEGPEREFVAMTSQHSELDCQSSSAPVRKPGNSGESRTLDAPPDDDPSAAAGTRSRTSRTQAQDGQRSQSLDSPLPDSAQTATPRNKQSRRTDLAPETSPPYTASGQMDVGTDDTPTLPGFGAPSVRTHGNRTGADSGGDAMATDPSVQSSGRSARISCTCIIPDHFATFPEKLVEPMILAGTSERGCCPQCGAPWERVVVREAMQIERSGNHPPDLRTRTSGTMIAPPSSKTISWRPTCRHDAEPVACRVLDPFAGSGTVGLVAERLGRHSVLIDASEDYCAMMRERTAQMGLHSTDFPLPTADTLPNGSSPPSRRRPGSFPSRSAVGRGEKPV
mgnify:CR=1 FL=1